LALSLVAVPRISADAAPTFTGVSSRTHSLSAVTDTAAEHAEHPGLNLVSAMAAWNILEPSDQVFDWAQMDANVEDARARGYRLILRIMAGRAAPTWLAGAGAEQLDLLGTDPHADDYCDHVTSTLPWDPVLKQQYRELMHEVGLWLDQPDGAGGRKGDHIYLIPISMPSYLGTEMVIGYGPSATCPGGTDAAGQNLRNSNLASWNTVSTETQRRALTEQAWRDAIDIHMQELPVQNDSLLAYGHLFLDGQAASLRISADKVAQYPTRLWSVYTNLQPAVRANGTLGPWQEFCPACHQTLLNAIQAGGTIGLHTADGAILSTTAKFRTAIDDALATYPLAFLEVNHELVDDHEAYLLSDPPSVQDRIAQVAGDRITTTALSCEPATVGAGSTCAATVTEFGPSPFGVPGGEVTWSASGSGSFSAGSCTPTGADGVSTCSVTYTPAAGSANQQTISGTYRGDTTHLGSGASTSISISDRASTTAVSCTPTSVVTGRPTTCTAVVSDAGPEGPLAPSGSVTWSSTAAGSFSPASCTLSGTGDRSCSVSFVPTATGTHAVNASYAGGPDHLPSSSSSAPATLTVSPDQPPAVAITSPLNNANVAKGKTITITATATDDIGVVRVVFSVSGAVKCTDTAAPYSCSWTIPKKANVTYTLLAVATDTAGRTASHSIVVTAR
jgi:hypothetical protein